MHLSIQKSIIADATLQFIRSNKDRPFFLYVPFTIPHVALQTPEDSLAFPERRSLVRPEGFCVGGGGIRVPLTARWPGKIQPASVSEHACAFWDFLPTCAELLGKQPPAGIGSVMGRCADNLRHNFCAGGVTCAGVPSTIPA